MLLGVSPYIKAVSLINISVRETVFFIKWCGIKR